MKLIIVLTLFGFSLAELKTYNEFKAYSPDKSVAEYANELGFSTFEHQFNKFKLDHNRNYGTVEEEEQRKFNFLKTLQFIEKHNELYKKGEVTHEVGISLFADKTKEEYEQTFSMPIPPFLNVTQVNDYEDDPTLYASLPQSFDWRAQHKVSPVKNQGGCGSCWAFTTNAMIESGYLIHHNQVLSLSEQQLIDCMHTNCGGQYINSAIDYVKAHGVGVTADYPYLAKASACRDNPAKFHAKVTGYRGLGHAAGRGVASDEEIMTAVMNNGPVGIGALDACGDDFGHYRGGILSTGAVTNKCVHAVTIVGWGSQNGQNYWIIKNSWGTQWGEGGFFRMIRGRDMRGMNDWLYYPTF